MAWVAAIAAAAQIAQMVAANNRKAPQGSGVGNIQLPDRSKYQAALLDTAFNPQSDVYQMASNRAMDLVNRDLANKGLGHSSFGNQAVSSAQADLAAKFLENEMQRRIQAYNAVTGYDIAKANQQQGVAGQQWNENLANYNLNAQKEDALYQGVGNLAGIGANYYGGVQQQNQIDAMNAQNQKNQDRYLSILDRSQAQGPSGGYTSYSPTAYNGYLGDYNLRNPYGR